MSSGSGPSGLRGVEWGVGDCVCPSVCVRTSELSACMRVRGDACMWACVPVCAHGSEEVEVVCHRKPCVLDPWRSLGRAISLRAPGLPEQKTTCRVKMDWHQ